MKSAWRVTRFLLNAVLWGFIVACFGLLGLMGIGPHFAHYQTLSVLSGSMRPGIPIGAMVLVTRESPRDLKVGQIITYQIPVLDHRVISHRVIQVVKGAGTDHPVIKTKGDDNLAPDPWLAQVTSPIVWQVRYSVPGVGRLVYLLRRPSVHTGAVRVVPALLAMLWLVGIWRREPGELITTKGGVGGAVPV
jgi:signal peptidase